jgi:hypothetical protein
MVTVHVDRGDKFGARLILYPELGGACVTAGF